MAFNVIGKLRVLKVLYRREGNDLVSRINSYSDVVFPSLYNDSKIKGLGLSVIRCKNTESECTNHASKVSIKQNQHTTDTLEQKKKFESSPLNVTLNEKNSSKKKIIKLNLDIAKNDLDVKLKMTDKYINKGLHVIVILKADQRLCNSTADIAKMQSEMMDVFRGMYDNKAFIKNIKSSRKVLQLELAPKTPTETPEISSHVDVDQ